MKSVTNKLAIMGVLLIALGITACTEQVENNSSETEMSSERMEANIKSLEIEVPAHWEEMNIEEKMQFMQSQEKGEAMGQGLGNGAGGNTDRIKIRFEEVGIEMPENWMELSREKRQKFMTENGM